MEHGSSDSGGRAGTVTGRHDSSAQPGVFSADPAHVRWFVARILRALPEIPARVLDIGSGDGSLLLGLASAMPHASFVGVDLSSANIAVANDALARSPYRSRIMVVHGNYLTFDAGLFDLVVASSSLQGIEASTDHLAEKLSRDVTPGGILIHVTPSRCCYNWALNTVRHGLRLARGRITDRMIVAAARALHPDHATKTLRERVDYMYLILRHDENGLRAALQRRGFRLLAAEAAPHTSLGQPKHRLAVMAAPARN